MALVLISKTPDAIDIWYDDSVSGFPIGADEVQTAIDILKSRNPFSMVTHQRNSAGHILSTYDIASNSHIASAPLVVVDSHGEIVLSGGY
jgi:hypothetical protein